MGYWEVSTPEKSRSKFGKLEKNLGVDSVTPSRNRILRLQISVFRHSKIFSASFDPTGTGGSRVYGECRPRAGRDDQVTRVSRHPFRRLISAGPRPKCGGRGS